MEVCVLNRKCGKRDIVEKLVKFYARYLGIDSSRAMLMVSWVKDLSKEHKASGITAYVDTSLIFVNIDSKLSMETLMITLAHEMIHVKQIVRGTLKMKNRKVFWCGKQHKRINGLYEPWEQQAYKRQYELVEALVDHVNAQIP